MKKLHLIRHAHAVSRSASGRDVDRPLSNRGRAWAQKLGPLIGQTEEWPERWLTSPAVRTRETAEALHSFAESPTEIEEISSLYGAEPREIVRVLATEAGPSSSAAVFAHNPGIEVLAAALTQEPDLDFRPGSALLVTLDCDSWGEMLGVPRLSSHLIISDA